MLAVGRVLSKVPIRAVGGFLATAHVQSFRALEVVFGSLFDVGIGAYVEECCGGSSRLQLLEITSQECILGGCLDYDSEIIGINHSLICLTTLNKNIKNTLRLQNVCYFPLCH